MSINNISALNQVLKDHKVSDWIKKTELPSIPGGVEGELALERSKNSSESFGNFLARSIGEVNKLQVDANRAMEKLATGESQNIHETMLSVKQAELAFKAMNQIRTKVIEAYKEVMRTQI